MKDSELGVGVALFRGGINHKTSGYKSLRVEYNWLNKTDPVLQGALHIWLPMEATPV